MTHARRQTRPLVGLWWREVLDESPDLEAIDEQQLDDLRQELTQALIEKRQMEAKAICRDWQPRQHEAAREAWNQVLIEGGRSRSEPHTSVQCSKGRFVVTIRLTQLRDQIHHREEPHTAACAGTPAYQGRGLRGLRGFWEPELPKMAVVFWVVKTFHFP